MKEAGAGGVLKTTGSQVVCATLACTPTRSAVRAAAVGAAAAAATLTEDIKLL